MTTQHIDDEAGGLAGLKVKNGRRWYSIDERDWQPMKIGDTVLQGFSWIPVAQDERGAIFEQRSAHIALGLPYLPALARRLYHARDLGEPFDFLTWFEFSEADAGAFDDLLGRLRETEEWRYVVREIEVRVRRR